MPEANPLAPQYAAAVLQWYLDNGVDEPLQDTPRNRLAPRVVESKPVEAASVANVSAMTPLAPSAPMRGGADAVSDAVALARGAQNLDELKAAIAGYEGLAIRKTAMNIVFADGNPVAKVMIVGDAPESDEDRAGKPFMGTQGQLLDKMFAAIGLNRTDTLYITQLLNWRPPGNRSPNQAEIDLSLPFLERHIALAKPSYLILMGPLVTKALMGGTAAKFRGALGTYKPLTADLGGTDIPCLVTHAPSILLKTPLKKREAWEDLLLLQQSLQKS